VLGASAVGGRRHQVAHGPRDGRAVALTFDDGPAALTAALLDVLARGGGRATFNVLGERVAGREGLLRRTLAEGHELGSHAYRHERLAGRPYEAWRQLRRTNRALLEATGVRPRTFRPPYGSASPGVVAVAALAGLVTVGWDVNPRDYREPTAEQIEERVMTLVRPGSIVLLHDDRRALDATVTATERLVARLGAEGYRLVTVSELLAPDRAPRRARRPRSAIPWHGGVPKAPRPRWPPR
jgi:peptidoglycan/xylan/chitin deacetylase (PgdA/CDA1 family)